jgi:hypothetical protein
VSVSLYVYAVVMYLIGFWSVLAPNWEIIIIIRIIEWVSALLPEPVGVRTISGRRPSMDKGQMGKTLKEFVRVP